MTGHSWTESCSLSLRSVSFFWLLSTPPRDGAVTSSPQPEHGSNWLGSPTQEGRDASQRTSGDIPVAVIIARSATSLASEGEFGASRNTVGDRNVAAPWRSRDNRGRGCNHAPRRQNQRPADLIGPRAMERQGRGGKRSQGLQRVEPPEHDSHTASRRTWHGWTYF